MKKYAKCLLKDITIIIPTYYRFNFLKRLLSFYESYDYKINIIILDSTPKSLKKDNDLLNFLSKNNILYIQYNENIQFVDKVYSGLKKVKTKYSVLCADDDFMIPEGLDKSINFLESNLDYISAHGIYFQHSLNSNSKFIFSQLYNHSKSLNKTSARKRFLDLYIYGKQGINSHWAVHRTKDLIFIWKETTKYAIGLGYAEFVPCAMSCIYGKMKILPVFYCSREKNFTPWYTNSQYIKMHSLYNTNKVIYSIKKHLSIVDKISTKEAEFFINSYSFDPRPDSMKEKKINNSILYYNLYKKIHNYFIKILNRFSFFFILNLLFDIAKGCPIIIYPNGLKDYKKIKFLVKTANCQLDDLDISRKKTIENDKLLVGEEN